MTASTVNLRVEPVPTPPNAVVFAPPPPQRRSSPAAETAPKTTAGARVPGHRQLQMRSHRLVQALVEIVDGQRPITQLLRLSTSAVYEELLERLTALNGATTRGRTAGPLCTRVASVHVDQPTATCAEIAARVVQGGRSRALAVRLDQVDDRWLCSAIRWG